MSIDTYHHLLGQTFPGETKFVLMLTTERTIHLTALFQRTLRKRGSIKADETGELPWQTASDWGLQRSLADPLPYLIILTCNIKTLGKKIAQVENSHIYGYICLCVFVCVSLKRN